MNRRDFLLGGLNAGALLALAGVVGWRVLGGEADDDALLERDFYAMGTRGTIRLAASDERHGIAMLDEAVARLRYLEEKLTKFSPYSDVGRLNAEPGKEVYVSQDTLRLFALGSELMALTAGGFDMGMGNFLCRPGLDPQVPRVGASELTQAERAQPLLTMQDRWVRLTRPNTMLDLGAIAKGYALEEAGVVLRQAGIRHAAIELGGDIAVLGGRPNGGPWKIGIDPKAPIARTMGGTLSVREGGVASSGAYLKRATDQHGKIKHHIVDPTAFASRDFYAMTTVIGPGATVCDALATAYFNTSVQDAPTLKRRFPDYRLIAWDSLRTRRDAKTHQM